MNKADETGDLEQFEHKLLSSGVEYFDDLISEIEGAQKYIVIKSFLWRNDEIGKKIAMKLHEAAERGVKILILKDRIAAFYEYAEQNGQSFFHDDLFNGGTSATHMLLSLYPQARRAADFYQNDSEPSQKNPLREEIVNHPNITVVDDYKLYDHSKVIVVDGESAYVGGINIGDEFEKDPGTWVDYMLKIKGSAPVLDLMRTISDLPERENQYHPLLFLSDERLEEGNSSMVDRTLSFMDKTKQQLTIEMPYLGKRDYISKLAELIERKVRVLLIVPLQANVNHSRNRHFVKTLRSSVDRSPLLEVAQLSSMVHCKVMIRDNDTAFFGSHNLNTDRRIFNETNIETSDPGVVADISAAVERDSKRAILLSDDAPWGEIIQRSLAEQFAIRFQTLMGQIRKDEVHRVRGECRKLISGIVEEFHGEVCS